jgi:hypothetical protein
VVSFPAGPWIRRQGGALNQRSQPEHPEPPEEVQGALRAGFNPEEVMKEEKSTEVYGTSRNSTDPPPPSPPPSPSLTPPPLLHITPADAAVVSKTASPKAKKPRKLTDEQLAWQQARLAQWDRCLRRYYHTPEGMKQPFDDAGVAVGFFATLAKAGEDGAMTDKAVDLFFARRYDWREKQREAAKAAGTVPPPVPVRVVEFRAQVREFLDMAKEATSALG